MTLSEEKIRKVFDAVSEAMKILEEQGGEYADILGIHLEGPFLSPRRSSVQGIKDLMLPKDGYDLVYSLEKDHPGLLKIIDIAPELEGAMEFIREFSGRYVISLAHTSADYDTAMKAFECGASSVTHLLNAMEPCSKRSPGILGAVSDRGDIWCEVICDGYHIAPPVLKMLTKIIPEDRFIIISDSMRAAGMPDGKYMLAETEVSVYGGRTHFGPNGDLAGSVTNMRSEVDNMISFGTDPLTVRKYAVDNPLKRLGIVNHLL